MGLFDIFKSKDRPGVVTGAGLDKVDKNVAKFARVAADKRAQNYDRLEAIEALGRIQSADAAAALLRRFNFHIDPSITDQEEKDAALRGILAAGDAAVEPIRAFCTKAESVIWPLKILKDLVPGERYVDELIKLLAPFDTEYARNVDPKQQLISELEHYNSPAVRPAVERFLEDVSEAIRFVAVATIFAQEDPEASPALVKTLITEESVRVKNRIAEGLAAREWPAPEELRVGLRTAMPQPFALDAQGVVKRR